MAVAPHIARLRQKVDHDRLLLPSVTVLPVDERERVRLVRQRDFGLYGTVGGAIDEDETPADAAMREAREEVGVEVELTGLVDAIGGSQFRVCYPNGDRCAYVSIVYTARIPGEYGVAPDGDEVTEVRWFARDELLHPEVAAISPAQRSQQSSGSEACVMATLHRRDRRTGIPAHQSCQLGRSGQTARTVTGLRG